jgi:hypothetical protein
MLIPLLAVVLAVGSAGQAYAQPRSIGSFQNWYAFADGKGTGKMCYLGSKPRKTEGKYASRGVVHFLVTHRPGEKVLGEISVDAGYAFKPGSEAAIDVDGRSFSLFTKGSNAWARDAASDKAIVAAMRAGSKMTVKGTSARGTKTTDFYSLQGFGAAYEAASKACDVALPAVASAKPAAPKATAEAKKATPQTAKTEKSAQNKPVSSPATQKTANTKKATNPTPQKSAATTKPTSPAPQRTTSGGGTTRTNTAQNDR